MITENLKKPRCLGAVLPGTALVVVCLAGGCGSSSDAPELGAVTGTVTLDGKPLPEATVRFQPLTEGAGRPAMAMTDEDGYYELQYSDDAAGAVLGKHVVRINTGQDGYDDGEYHPPVPEKVPVQYNRDALDNPEMTIEIKPGANEFNFILKPEGEVVASEDEGSQGPPGGY